MDKRDISNFSCCLGIYVQLCLTTGQFMGLGLVSLLSLVLILWYI